MPPPLPIDPVLPSAVAALRSHAGLVLQAEPGAGKTTRVPRALVESGVAGSGEVLVLQPRRLATRLAAARVASEWGEPLGQRVGYQVRFEEVGGPKTVLRFVTEGILTRRLLSTPDLPGVGAVVLDEFHERHLTTDLGLALLRRLQGSSRPELKLLVMSATLETGPIARYLGGCPVLSSEGRAFPVEVEYLAAPDDRPLEQQVLGALKRTVLAGLEGDILVFLPGAREIRRSRELCADWAQRHGIELHLLHGELSNAEQDRAVSPGARRKVILSTNVAETSVTVEGVAVVIDSGLARVAAQAPGSGLPTLKLSKVSRASAIQRTGRAGRTRPGHCFRLYTKADFEARSAHDLPEIHRLDLAETLLSLAALGVRNATEFPFFDPPPDSATRAAAVLLQRLGAIDEDGAITTDGRRMLEQPLHPRLSRVMLDAEARGYPAEGALLAALLSEREVRLEARGGFAGDRGPRRARISAASDALEAMERFLRAKSAGFSDRALRAENLDGTATRAVEAVRSRLARGGARRAAPTQGSREPALLQALLAGFPDRVAKRRKPGSPEVLLFGGSTARLAEQSAVHEAEFLVALSAEESKRPGDSATLIRVASEVQPEWLLGLEAHSLSEVDTLTWNKADGRVERLTRLAYGSLALDESRSVAPPSEAASKLLAEAAAAQGWDSFFAPGTLDALRAKLETLRAAYPEADYPAFDEAGLAALLTRLCEGLRSFEELRDVTRPYSPGSLGALLEPSLQRAWSTRVPDSLTLAGGRRVTVQYALGQPPWCESRLQDFFGSSVGPSICEGRVLLTLHLLAPNGRAVQVTRDLAGFWERHYPSIRKELSRRYPRHAWPEDPVTASPPAPRPPRR